MLASVVLLGFASPSLADAQSHCELYSRDFADSRTGNVDRWQLLYRSAFIDCMQAYNAKPSEEPPAVAESVEPAPEPDAEPIAEPAGSPPAKKQAAKPKPRKIAARKTTSRVAARNLVPGSEAWNAFCAAKYSSFNKQSGTYLSNSGKIRRCSTTR